jgi:hypothetical protein
MVRYQLGNDFDSQLPMFLKGEFERWRGVLTRL